MNFSCGYFFICWTIPTMFGTLFEIHTTCACFSWPRKRLPFLQLFCLLTRLVVYTGRVFFSSSLTSPSMGSLLNIYPAHYSWPPALVRALRNAANTHEDWDISVRVIFHVAGVRRERQACRRSATAARHQLAIETLEVLKKHRRANDRIATTIATDCRLNH